MRKENDHIFAYSGRENGPVGEKKAKSGPQNFRYNVDVSNFRLRSCQLVPLELLSCSRIRYLLIFGDGGKHYEPSLTWVHIVCDIGHQST